MADPTLAEIAERALAIRLARYRPDRESAGLEARSRMRRAPDTRNLCADPDCARPFAAAYNVATYKRYCAPACRTRVNSRRHWRKKNGIPIERERYARG